MFGSLTLFIHNYVHAPLLSSSLSSFPFLSLNLLFSLLFLLNYFFLLHACNFSFLFSLSLFGFFFFFLIVIYCTSYRIQLTLSFSQPSACVLMMISISISLFHSPLFFFKHYCIYCGNYAHKSLFMSLLHVSLSMIFLEFIVFRLVTTYF